MLYKKHPFVARIKNIQKNGHNPFRSPSAQILEDILRRKPLARPNVTFNFTMTIFYFTNLNTYMIKLFNKYKYYYMVHGRDSSSHMT